MAYNYRGQEERAHHARLTPVLLSGGRDTKQMYLKQKSGTTTVVLAANRNLNRFIEQDAFNRQTRTTGISEITLLNRTCRGADDMSRSPLR
jgi:hypothetical protein